MRIIAVVPAYDESDNIGKVVSETRHYVHRVVVVDDGSRDDTGAIADGAGALVVPHPENLGIGSALMTGYNQALQLGADVVVQLDADGQHDPSYIPEMASKIADGYHLVVASRFLDPAEREPRAWRTIGIFLYSRLLSWLLAHGITDATSGYRAIRADALPLIRGLPSRHWAICQTFDMISLGFRYAEVAVRMSPRIYGNSQFSLPTAFLYHYRVARELIPRLIRRSQLGTAERGSRDSSTAAERRR